MNIDHDQKRGRGRPRKNQMNGIDIEKKKNKLSNDVDKKEEEPIILHMPNITKDDLCCPDIFSKHDSDYVSQENAFTIDDVESTSSSEESIGDINTIKELKSVVKYQNKEIESLKKELEEYKKLSEQTSNVEYYKMNERKIYKIDLKLIHVEDGRKIVVEKTNIPCWWCTYNFDNFPCFLPVKYYEDEYHVFGCFCSVRCVITYNMNMTDYNVWDRHGLILKMYKELIDSNSCIASTPAPPREAFEKFGGKETYEGYRNTVGGYIKEYRLILPPMTSITPIIEETYKDTFKVGIKLSDIKKKSMARTKPLPNNKNKLITNLAINMNSESSKH